MTYPPVIVIVELADRRAMLTVRAVGGWDRINRINNISPTGTVYASRNKYTHELERFKGRINLL